MAAVMVELEQRPHPSRERRVQLAKAAAQAVAKLAMLCPDELLVVALHSLPLDQDPRPTSEVAHSIRQWWAWMRCNTKFHLLIHGDLIKLRDLGILELLLHRLEPNDADAIIGALEDAESLSKKGSYFW